MRLTISYLLAVSLFCATSSGCFIYFDDDDDCLFGGAAEVPAAEPALGLRNPESGQCEYFGGGGGGGSCDDRCGPCPADGPQADPAPLPSWGFCESECTYLEEGSCLASDGCRGIYGADGFFAACWSTDQTGPIRGGECAGLDAWSCSLHDDCVAIHETPCAADGGQAGDEAPGAPVACDVGEFLSCGDEPGDSPQLCYGIPDCDLPPPDCQPGTLPVHDGSCYTGACIPESDCEDPPPPACAELQDEATCIARPECTPLYEGQGCSCDATGCGCDSWVFTRCQ